ncbi:MAG: AAA family ATPase [Solirubrobacterales bacterium]
MDQETPTSDLTEGIWHSARATRTSIEPNSMSDALYMEHAHRHRLAFRKGDSWPTEAEIPTIDGATTLLRTVFRAIETVVMVVDDVLVLVRIQMGRVTANLAGHDQKAVERVLEQLRVALPVPKIPPEVPRVSFSFSWKSDSSAMWTSRTLDVTRWPEVSANYVASTRRSLDNLLRRFRPERSGQTIVWHGDPGTGKTHALRALAYEWREWCDVHIVTDPDQLFGADAGYLMEVLTSPPSGSGGQDDRYRLIVLEDSGELLTGDARRLVGHGLSRFLNLCDGLLGQAERLILLVTTNEPMKRLHPAVRRSGRCAAEVEFLPFDRRSANRWLARRSEVRVAERHVIADLYALAEGREPNARIGNGATIGFTAGLAG